MSHELFVAIWATATLCVGLPIVVLLAYLLSGDYDKEINALTFGILFVFASLILLCAWGNVAYPAKPVSEEARK